MLSSSKNSAWRKNVLQAVLEPAENPSEEFNSTGGALPRLDTDRKGTHTCWTTHVQCPVSITPPPPPQGTAGPKDPRFFHGVLQSPAEISRCAVRVPLKAFTGLAGLPLLKIVYFLCRRTGIWGTLTNPIGQSSSWGPLRKHGRAGLARDKRSMRSYPGEGLGFRTPATEGLSCVLRGEDALLRPR